MWTEHLNARIFDRSKICPVPNLLFLLLFLFFDGIVVVAVINSSSSRNWALFSLDFCHDGTGRNFRLAENSCVQVFCLHGNTLNVRKFRRLADQSSCDQSILSTEYIEPSCEGSGRSNFLAGQKFARYREKVVYVGFGQKACHCIFFVLMEVIVWYQTVKSFFRFIHQMCCNVRCDSYCDLGSNSLIGHFRVPKTLTFKTSALSCQNEFYLQGNNKSFSYQ